MNLHAIAFLLVFATSAFGFNPGDRVQCNGTNVNVRNTSCTAIGQVNSPTRGTVQSGSVSCTGCGSAWTNVNWDTGISGYTCGDFLTLVAPAPTLSSIAPNPVAGSNSAVTLTLHGTNFVSGAKVQVAYAGNGYSFVDTNTNATFVSSTTLTVPITTQVQADTWHVRVRNPDGQLSGQIDLVVTVTPAPTLSSISPNPVAGSNGPVTFTLHGTNFVSGAKVQVAYLGNGYSFVDTNTNATFVNSTTLTVPITTQVQADTWHVRVKNPDGQLSGQIDLVVTTSPTPTPTPAAPTLSSTSPNPVAGSNSPVTFTVHGTNFVSGAKVQVAYFGNGYSFVDTNTNATFVNSTTLTVPITTQVQADTWHVRVKNPDGQLSGQIDLVVTTTPTPTPGPTAPTLSSISPNPVAGSNSPVTFTLHGTNFASGAKVQVAYAGNGYTFVDTDTGATFINSTTLTVPITTQVQADTWHVRVRNPDGQFSGQIDLVVTVTTPTPTPPGTPTPIPSITPTPAPGVPTISSVSPNPVQGSTSSQPFTINGTNFTSSSVVNLRNITTATSYLNRTVNSQTGTRLVINPIFGTETHNWSVEVVNRTSSSGQFQFSVQTPQAMLRPDLVPSNVQAAPVSVSIGDLINVTLTITNQGAGDAVASTTRVRISNSPTSTSANDIVLGDIATPAIATGSSVSRPGSFTIPPGVLSGPNYVWVSVDNLNVTNQSNGTNDYAHSQPVTVATSPGAAPVILSLTGDQSVNQGEVATFRVFASGSQPLSYQWKRNNSQIVYSTSNSLVTGQAGTYTVDVSNIADTTRSNPTTLTVSGSTPPVIIPAEGSLILYPAGSAFEPAWDTVVITHGWQPTGNYDPMNPLAWQQSMAEAIRARLNNQVNVFLFMWPEAYTLLNPAGAFLSTASEGSKLATYLQEFFGSTYQKKIHLVGHSFGAYVNSFAVPKLRQHVSQVSLLDAPINVRDGGLVSIFPRDIDFVFTYLLRGRVEYVDSYIADVPYLGFTFGGDIAGAAPNGGLHLLETHPSIHEFYERTVPHGPSGFNFSILLGDSREPLAGWRPPSLAFQFLAGFTDTAGAFFGGIFRDVDYVAGVLRDIFRLHTSGSPVGVIAGRNQAEASAGDSALEFEVAVPSNAEYLKFNFEFSQVGEGDWMTLSFNDEVIYSFLGKNFSGGSYDEAVVPMSRFAGQAGVIRVILHAASTADAEVKVANFRFESPLQQTQLGNIATRLNVGTGDNAMIGGFIITGTQEKTVIVRGLGPSLGALGVPDALADPIIEVHDSSGALILGAINDNWNDAATRQEIIDSGLAPTNPLESALWGKINPGAYTVVVRGKNNGTGNGLFDVYDLDQTADSKLANISTRGFVNTGDNVMIGGTIITGSALTNVIVRAIGPSLANFGVPNPLQDPTLELRDSNGSLLESNDNWRSAHQAEIVAAGLAPTDDRESAIFRTLAPGAYTAIVRGSNNSTGVAVVEAYQLQ
jgi:pimeloyl-ACP methyl ester carboxylesterase